MKLKFEQYKETWSWQVNKKGSKLFLKLSLSELSLYLNSDFNRYTERATRRIQDLLYPFVFVFVIPVPRFLQFYLEATWMIADLLMETVLI